MTVDSHPESAADEMIVQEDNTKRKNGLRPWWLDNWRGILSELISTFLLLFLGCMACIPIDGFPKNPPMYGALGFGLIVLINIQTFGHISGAFMNPAVTLAAVIWGNMSIAVGLAYFVAQCLGAVMGYGALMGMSPIDLYPDGVCTTLPHEKHNIYQALGIEIFLTASLVFINCNLWDPVSADKVESNPIKLGLTVAGLSIAGGPLTGASMNPARSLAPAFWTDTWNGHWIYWVGPIVGSVLATLFYKYIWLKLDKAKPPKVLHWTEIE
ncbi:aquaporin-like [Pararge aegeria]|uniref:Jg7063 protein n=1 Tax=Pararge aegeria aegeria TaxID=348720 RepID=A0A8S4RIH0_9NEOP|nr:aquaporin-like [Pararge aegeria]CAH2236300.1 jg7063 [Pararge aegeria aegeria]